MASTFGTIMDNLGDRLDEDLLPAVYEAASVSTADVRASLRDAGIPFIDREAGQIPTPLEIEESAERLIRQARDRATVMGAASGLVGAPAVPPEVLASVVQMLRLGQRLAVVHGIDPETDAGKLLLWRAIAAAYEVELPEGLVGVRVRDVPALVKAQIPATRQATLWLLRQVIQRTITSVAGRFTRLIPGVGAGFAAYSARWRTVDMGERMREVFRRAADGEPFDFAGTEAAVEVR